MSKPKKYKTGDVVTVRKAPWHVGVTGANWAVVGHPSFYAWISESRKNARAAKHAEERIARVIKETPKTVTVVISK